MGLLAGLVTCAGKYGFFESAPKLGVKMPALGTYQFIYLFFLSVTRVTPSLTGTDLQGALHTIHLPGWKEKKLIKYIQINMESK